jgi:hypothetical protein
MSSVSRVAITWAVAGAGMVGMAMGDQALAADRTCTGSMKKSPGGQ